MALVARSKYSMVDLEALRFAIDVATKAADETGGEGTQLGAAGRNGPQALRGQRRSAEDHPDAETHEEPTRRQRCELQVLREHRARAVPVPRRQRSPLLPGAEAVMHDRHIRRFVT